MRDADWITYFEELASRQHEARILRYEYRDPPSDGAKCHQIVDFCVRGSQHSKAIRGWRVIPQSNQPSLFIAHSVLGLDTGEWLEVTYDDHGKFLEHRGSAEAFEYLRVRHAVQPWPPLSHIPGEGAEN